MLVYFGVRDALGMVMPFLMAWMVSAIVRPLAFAAQRRLRIPYKIASVILIIALICLCGFALFCFGSMIFTQARNFLNELTRDIDSPRNPLRVAFDLVVEMKDKIPFFGAEDDANVTAISESLYAVLTDTIKNGIQKISGATAMWAASFVKSLPGAAFFAVVSVISAFYITVDYDKIAEFFQRVMLEKAYDALIKWKRQFLLTMSNYIKAYSLLMIVTFTELFAGFLVINVKYPLIMAIVITAVDVLPVIGAGSVLVPWALMSFVTGDYVTVWGIAVIFCVMYVVRQVMESRIVGSFIGIHPIAALISVYVGWHLFGLVGMIAGPTAALSVKLILSEWMKRV